MSDINLYSVNWQDGMLINQKHLASSDITDVISFCYDPMPCDKGSYSAEIIVNVQQAVREGAHHGIDWNPSLELALYIAHGCDHLTAENDCNKAGRARMRRRELRWLKEARTLGLTDKLEGSGP